MSEPTPGESAASSKKATAPGPMHRTKSLRPINHVVAFNLAQARKAKGWTQEEAAQRLHEVSGQPWSAATLGAAERIARSGRTREFNANELIAFCLAFDQPLAYFFIPALTRKEIDVELVMRSKVPENTQQATVSEYELLSKTVPFRPSPVVVDSVNKILAKRSMGWDPSKGAVHWNEWFEDWEGPDPDPEDIDEAAGSLGSDPERILKSLGVTPEAIEEAVATQATKIANMVVLQLLETARRPMPRGKGWPAPEEPPPF